MSSASTSSSPGPVLRVAAARKPLGAQRRTEASPFGATPVRQAWKDRMAAFSSLEEAVSQLQSWRQQHATGLSTPDSLWIEAALEHSVARWKLRTLPPDAVASHALSGESLHDIRVQTQAALESWNVETLEALARSLRSRYKPPIVPVSFYMHLEVLVAERLMKARARHFNALTLGALRQYRSAQEVDAA